MRSPVQITFFVPCFNEAENVVPTVQTIQEAASQENISYEILVVDDGSTDQTCAVLGEYMRLHPQFPIVLLENGTNRGLGYSYLYGASQAKGEYYVYIPGDNCTPTEMIRRILKEMGKAEMIIPYVENQKIRTLSRRLISKAFTALVNLLNGFEIKYYNGPVLHKRENILRCKNIGRGFAYQAEIVSQLLQAGCSYLQIPYESTNRKAGSVSAFRFTNILSVLGSLVRIFKSRFFRSRDD